MTNSKPTLTEPKTIQELREILKDKMIDLGTGGFKNPFSDTKTNSVHAYKSRAIDAAVKYFTSSELGQKRRVKHLGEEWKVIT